MDHKVDVIAVVQIIDFIAAVAIPAMGIADKGHRQLVPVLKALLNHVNLL